MNHWHPVAHRSELARPGDFIVLPWSAHGEIAVTNIGGELVAFDNRCPHRGARIYGTEPRGNRPPACPYHGRLASANNVRRFPIAALGEFLFARNPSAGAAPLLGPPMIGLLKDAPPLAFHSALSFVMDCHWTVAVENALDFEHVEHVHGGSLAKLALVPKRLRPLDDGSSIEEFTSEAQRLGHLTRFFRHEKSFDYVHAHIFPYSCVSSTRGWTYSLQHYFPRADGRTNFIHRLYTAETTRPMPEFFDSVARLNERVFREDAVVCAGIPAWFAGELGPREDRIRHFRKFAGHPSHAGHLVAADSEGGEL